MDVVMDYLCVNWVLLRGEFRDFRIIIVFEILLEYSLVILLVGCFLLVFFWFKFYGNLMDFILFIFVGINYIVWIVFIDRKFINRWRKKRNNVIVI